MSRSLFAWGVAVVDVVLFIAASLVDPEPDYGAIVLYLLGIGAFVGIGALLIGRVPTNPIGALMLATGTVSVAAATIGTYADLGALHDPAWPGIAVARDVGNALFIVPIIIALVGIPLVFPDGRLPSLRFRWVVLLTIVGTTSWMVNAVFDTGFDVIVLISMPVAFCGAILATSLRFRRGDPIERQQVKWLAAVVIVGATSVLAGLLLNSILADLANVLIIVGIAALFALPFVVGLAILRYRLYEIDRIISRTLAYGVVTAILAAVYGGAIVLSSSILASFVQGGQTIAVAASTLAVFALFQPVLRRVRHAVDRRFDRASYDAARTASAFSERLRWQTEMDVVTSDLAATAEAAVAPTALGIWLRRSAGKP